MHPSKGLQRLSLLKLTAALSANRVWVKTCATLNMEEQHRRSTFIEITPEGFMEAELALRGSRPGPHSRKNAHKQLCTGRSTWMSRLQLHLSRIGAANDWLSNQLANDFPTSRQSSQVETLRESIVQRGLDGFGMWFLMVFRFPSQSFKAGRAPGVTRDASGIYRPRTMAHECLLRV